MCMSTPSAAPSAQITEQLNKGNAILSNEKTASTTGEKAGNKRTMTSLRVPMKDKGAGVTGINTTDSATGLNIPV